MAICQVSISFLFQDRLSQDHIHPFPEMGQTPAPTALPQPLPSHQYPLDICQGEALGGLSGSSPPSLSCLHPTSECWVHNLSLPQTEWLKLQKFHGFKFHNQGMGPWGLHGKESACQSTGSIPGSGISPGEGNGNPFQYSCLGNPMDRGAWWAIVHGVAKSRTRLSN